MSDRLPTRKEFMRWTDAGFFAKRNQIIQAIDDLLDRYQGLTTEFAKGIAAFKIIEYCNEYEQHLANENRGSRRWNGVHVLRGLAADEYKRLLPMIRAKVAFKENRGAAVAPAERARQNFRNLMHNPKFKVLGEIQNRGSQPGAKRLEDGEILEVLDDLHRVGHGLKKIHNQWLYDTSTKKNFWDYLEEYLIAHPNETPYRVKYLKENERRAYQIRFRGGQMMQGEAAQQQPFDTRQMAINKANPNNAWGRAIFVQSIDREVFSGGSFSNPVARQDGSVDLRKSGDILHHSSFLVGKPVLCAGEWLVENGAIITISPQSGHYRPPVNIFQDFLRDLKNRGAMINRITVEWYFNGSNHYYNADEFARANQIFFSSEPYHNGVALRELQNMRDSTVYKVAPPIPTRHAPPIPARNAPPLPPRHQQSPPPLLRFGQNSPSLPPRQGQAPLIPARNGPNQNNQPGKWAVVQPPDRFGR